MLVKTKAIVIATTKYQEKSLIVKCLTFSDGVKSYFVHNAFTGKNNKQKAAFFQPLNQVEIEAVHKNKGTLERFKEIKIAHPYYTIHSDIVKTTIVLFLSEVLNNVLKEENKNEELFEFLETALLWFDNNDEVSNFHLILLTQLTKYLGFFPQNHQTENIFFNLQEGVFQDINDADCLSESDSILFKKLISLKFGQAQKLFNGAERQKLLRTLLNYYSANLDSFRKLKSLEVLIEVFS